MISFAIMVQIQRTECVFNSSSVWSHFDEAVPSDSESELLADAAVAGDDSSVGGG